jgi:ferredoxin
LQAFSCVECGRCTEHCPAYNTGKILNPKEIVLGLRDYLKEFGPNAEAPLLGKFISEEAAFQCTTCGSCEFQCPVGIQHLPMIIGLRRGAVNTGKWENEYGAKLFLNLERNGNALGFSAAERQKFIEKNELPFYDGTQEYCLWLGCMGAYDPQGREIVPGPGARACATPASPSACCAKRSAPATRPAASATTSPYRRSPKPTSRRCAPPKWARWYPSARIASAPSARTGASTAELSRLSITASY